MSVENWTRPHASTGTLSMSWMRALWASVGSSTRYAFPTSFSYGPERPNDIPSANGSRRVISTRTTPCGAQDAFEAAGAVLTEPDVSRPAPTTTSRSLLRSPSLPPAARTPLLFIRLPPWRRWEFLAMDGPRHYETSVYMPQSLACPRHTSKIEGQDDDNATNQ